MPLYTFASAAVGPGTPGPGVGTGANFGNVSLAGLLFESSTDGITASATQTQAAATPLTTELNRVTTVATAGDGVALPASVAGMTVLVCNKAAKPMQVYGSGTDTINDVATATGVSQMQGSVVLYTCYTAGAWYSEGLATGYTGGFQTLSAKDSIVAKAGGGQASATLITSMLNRVVTVASAADSVLLPPSAAGMSITITNAHASNAVAVFPNGATDVINAIAAQTAFSLAATKSAEFVCHTAGQWHTLLSA